MVAALLVSGCGGGAPATADVPATLDAPDAAVIVTPIDVPLATRDGGRVDRPPTSRCDDGQRDCYPVGCRDLLTDRQTCGSCSRSCDDTARCEGGRCVALPAGHVLCGEEAVVLASNDRHCGRCGRRCAEGERCFRGTCGPLRCDAPLLLCAEGEPCVDPSNDATHCGACGRVCAAGERCMGGECVCQPGLTRCGDRCVDLLSDRENCGNCGVRACGEAICHVGRVLEFCPPGSIVCPSMSETCTVCYSPRNCEGLCGGCCGSCTFGVCRNGVCVDR